MLTLDNLLSLYFTEPNHCVFYHYATAGYFLNKVPRIALACTAPQIDHTGINRQVVLFYRTYHIARHAERHRGIVSGLKLSMDQCLLALNMDADEAIGMSCGGLLCVKDVEDFNIVSSDCESDEIFGVGLDEMFGDGVIFSHARCPGSDG